LVASSPSIDNSAVADANIAPVATDNVDPAQDHIAAATPLAAPVTLMEVLHNVRFFLDRKSWFKFLQDDGKSLTSEDEVIYLPNSGNGGEAKKKTRTIIQGDIENGYFFSRSSTNWLQSCMT
jgi:hypothetical protein